MNDSVRKAAELYADTKHPGQGDGKWYADKNGFLAGDAHGYQRAMDEASVGLSAYISALPYSDQVVVSDSSYAMDLWQNATLTERKRRAEVEAAKDKEIKRLRDMVSGIQLVTALTPDGTATLVIERNDLIAARSGSPVDVFERIMDKELATKDARIAALEAEIIKVHDDLWRYGGECLSVSYAAAYPLARELSNQSKE